jgi:hypothetical protein
MRQISNLVGKKLQFLSLQRRSAQNREARGRLTETPILHLHGRANRLLILPVRHKQHPKHRVSAEPVPQKIRLLINLPTDAPLRPQKESPRLALIPLEPLHQLHPLEPSHNFVYEPGWLGFKS